jgi:hypothetical protein
MSPAEVEQAATMQRELELQQRELAVQVTLMCNHHSLRSLIRLASNAAAPQRKMRCDSRRRN